MLMTLVLPTSDEVMVDDSDGWKSVVSCLHMGSDEGPFVGKATPSPESASARLNDIAGRGETRRGLTYPGAQAQQEPE